MIHFVRRLPSPYENKTEQKNRLRSEIDNILKDEFSSFNIDYCKNQLDYNEQGKPYLKNSDLFFNISHCDELAVCIVENCEIGIDAEKIREYYPRVAKRVFSEREMEILENSHNKNEAFFRIWTLKESFVKALGIGISYPMKSCEFLITDNGVTAIGCDGYSFSQIVLNDSFICAVCIKDKNRLQNNFYRVIENRQSFSIKI